jgi:hypothetical protein
VAKGMDAFCFLSYPGNTIMTMKEYEEVRVFSDLWNAEKILHEVKESAVDTGAATVAEIDGVIDQIAKWRKTLDLRIIPTT